MNKEKLIFHIQTLLAPDEKAESYALSEEIRDFIEMEAKGKVNPILFGRVMSFLGYQKSIKKIDGKTQRVYYINKL